MSVAHRASRDGDRSMSVGAWSFSRWIRLDERGAQSFSRLIKKDGRVAWSFWRRRLSDECVAWSFSNEVRLMGPEAWRFSPWSAETLVAPALHESDHSGLLLQRQQWCTATIGVPRARDATLLERRSVALRLNPRNGILQGVLAWVHTGDGANQQTHIVPWHALQHTQMPCLCRLERVQTLRVDRVAEDHGCRSGTVSWPSGCRGHGGEYTGGHPHAIWSYISSTLAHACNQGNIRNIRIWENF